MLARCQYCNTRVRAKQLPVHEKHCPRKRFALRTQAQRLAQAKPEVAEKEVAKEEPRPRSGLMHTTDPLSSKKNKKAKA